MRDKTVSWGVLGVVCLLACLGIQFAVVMAGISLVNATMAKSAVGPADFAKFSGLLLASELLAGVMIECAFGCFKRASPPRKAQ